MINCGSMGSLMKRESSSSNLLTTMNPSSPPESSTIISDSMKSAISDMAVDHHHHSQLQSSSSSMSLAPPSLNFPTLKLQLEEEGEVQSPTSALLESLLSDNHLDGDFMISSPIRNPSNENLMLTSPYPTNPNPVEVGYLPRVKTGMSPLNRVYNSPSNTHYMQTIEELLEEYQQCFDMSDDLVGSASASSGSRFFGGSSAGSSRLSHESHDVYSHHHHQVIMDDGAAVGPRMKSSVSAPNLSQQLEQDRQQEKLLLSMQQQQQQQQQHGIVNGLVASLPAVSEQEQEQEQEQDSGLQLVHLLLACAEAVAKEDYMTARKYLYQLNRVVSPLGDSMQRVAAFFTDALSARLASTLAPRPATSSKTYVPFCPITLENLKFYQILYQACPYIKFAHFTANQAIFEAIEFEERVHVIDLDILQGYQWPAFMQALAARPGGPPFLRLTGVGPSLESVRETGRCLTELALNLHIPFEFHAVGEQLEDLRAHMLHRRVGEALAVNSVSRLHQVPGHCLGSLLGLIRDQAPNIVTLVEQEASHNGPYFLGRFLEALHYYSAIFDSLDATFPAESPHRSKVEQYIFAPEIKNIVATEGAERTERHEKLEKWRKIMEGKGFKGVPLSGNAVTQSKILLGLYSCDGYRLTEDNGCLLLGWQDRSLVAASAWRC